MPVQTLNVFLGAGSGTTSDCVTTFFGDVIFDGTLYADCTIYLEN